MGQAHAGLVMYANHIAKQPHQELGENTAGVKFLADYWFAAGVELAEHERKQ